MEIFIVSHWYLFLALLVVVAALVAQPLLESASGVRRVESAEAVQIINRQAGVVIDVREPAEFKNGHIAKAINIPLSQINTRSQELKKFKGRPLIVCCAGGLRSARAAAALRRQGFPTACNLVGGVNAWRTQNLPLE